MTFYFAYGSNMNRAAMRRRCPGAAAVGPARLAGYRFIMSADGYASVAPAAGDTVHGVLWRLTPSDVAALNAYEAVDSGLYRRRLLPVVQDGRRRRALVYVGRRAREGRPKPGHLADIMRAARDWRLPEPYLRRLARRAPSAWPGLFATDTGVLG